MAQYREIKKKKMQGMCVCCGNGLNHLLHFALLQNTDGRVNGLLQASFSMVRESLRNKEVVYDNYFKK